MTTNDTNTKNRSQETENISAIYLKVDQKDEGVSIECNYHQASTTLLLQSIAYMLDTAFKGDAEQANKVAEVIPSVVDEYFRLKKAEAGVDKAREDLNEFLKTMDEEAIKNAIKEEMSKEDMDMDYVMKMTSELMRRGVDNDRTRDQKKSADS